MMMRLTSRHRVSGLFDSAALNVRRIVRSGSSPRSVCALALLTGTAYAQTQPPLQIAAAESATDVLEEVIVTARKRSEVLQNVPESIQAFGERELADAHINKLDDLGGFVSNLNITTRADNNPDVVLRGVGSFGVVQGVGFYANDVQLFDGQTVRPDDLERIEVLKGPQGTLYGGNNIGGAIKYITKLPTDTFEGKATVEAGNYDTQTYSGFLSGPLSPGVLDGRISAYGTTTDGYIYDTVLNKPVSGGTQKGGRITLLYKPTEATTATLLLNGDWNRSGVGANIYYTPDSAQDYSLNVRDGTQPEYSRTLYSATLRLEHELTPSLALTSISSYFHSYADSVTDTDKGPLPFLTGFNHFRRDVYTEELRLANSDAGALKWLFGVFGQVNNNVNALLSRQFIGDPSNPANFNDPTQFADQFTDPQQRHHEYALFGNATYEHGKWTFETGLRLDYNDSSMTDGVYGLFGQQHGTQVLPKFSLAYHFAKDVMGYTTISRGFEPGDLVEGFDANGNPLITQYKAEKTWNYEAGLKSTLFDRVRFNAAVFYIQYDERLFQTNIIESGQLVGVTENIGSSHNYGGEFDVSTRLTRELLFSGSFGVTKAIWGNVPVFDSDLDQPTNLQGRTATNTPSYQGSVSLDWSHNLTDRLVFGARVDASFVGYSFWDVTDHYRQNPYQLVNLGVRLEGNRWSVSGHVSNLTNQLYNTAFISAAELQAPFNVAGIGQPRLWSAAVSYHW
jgi:iron complex outermembrane receptor protein